MGKRETVTTTPSNNVIMSTPTDTGASLDMTREDDNKVVPFRAKRDPSDPWRAGRAAFVELLERRKECEYLDQELITHVLGEVNSGPGPGESIVREMRENLQHASGESVTDTEVIGALYDALDEEAPHFARGYAESLMVSSHNELAIPGLIKLLKTSEQNPDYEDWERDKEEREAVYGEDDSDDWYSGEPAPPRDLWEEGRVAAARALGRWVATDAALHLVVAMESDESSDVRFASAMALTRILPHYRELFDELSENWKAHPRETRLLHAIALSTTLPEALEYLMTVVDEADSYIDGALADEAIRGLWRVLRRGREA